MLLSEELGGSRQQVIQETAQWVSDIEIQNNRRTANDEQEHQEKTLLLTYLWITQLWTQFCCSFCFSYTPIMLC